MVPSSLLIAQSVQNIPFARPLKILFDTGSDISFINSSCLPKGTVPRILATSSRGLTAAGLFSSKRLVTLKEIVLPEFTRSKHISAWDFYLFDAPCPYDILIGREFLNTLKIDPLCSTRTTTWGDFSVPFKPRSFWNDPYNVRMALATQIQESKYDQTTAEEVASKQLHLTQQQQQDLVKILQGYPDLFSGKLGLYPHRKVHLDLVEGAQPIYLHMYSVPHLQLPLFKKELDRLCSIGVLIRCGASEWGAPTFIIPKKDGRVRWVSDFRALNKLIKRKIYPFPVILDILRRRSGYQFFTKLDLSMQFYCFMLDEESQQYCVIITPFGNFKYLRLPMGIKQSPDIAQEIMEDTLRGIEGVEVYIDDIGIFSNSWETHVATLHQVLQRLQDNGFTVNPLKCEWAVKETEWLGYWLTPTGLKPWRKKIDAILRLQRPTNIKELRSFIGAVTFYRDMWPHRSHILAPLTELTGNVPFVWTERHQHAFDQMRSLLAEDALLRYPDHNLPFHLYTDASDYQLGSVIQQEGVPVAYYSRKLSSAQRNYTTIEKELLSIVETLREFRSMLFGADIHIHTDHRNLTYNNLTSQRVLRWRLFLEDFTPTFHYIKGSDNVLADALSRLPIADAPINPSLEGKSAVDSPASYSIMLDDASMLQCFLHHPDPADIPFPLEYTLLRQQQFDDMTLQEARNSHPDHYPIMNFGDVQLMCYVAHPGDSWRIAIPTQALYNIVRWYHAVLNHVGMTRLHLTIATHFYHPQLRFVVNTVVRECTICQRYKLAGPGYGKLPPREANLAPWDEVAVDLIGIWKIEINGQQLEFNALTCIDPVTNLTELIRINNRTSAHVAMKFENEWLSRYPRPLRCVHDQGPEFKGAEFQHMLFLNGIKPVATSIKNPQSNAVCERMHQTVTNILRPLLHAHLPATPQAANDIIDTALATALYASRASLHRTLHISPGALVFHHDMLLNIPLIADLALIRDHRQVLIDENLRQQNMKRRSYDYQVGQQVLLLNPKEHPGKLEPRATKGPFTIVQVHTNGMVTLQKTDHTTLRINIRRIRPYRAH